MCAAHPLQAAKPASIATPMSPKRKLSHRPVLDPAYLADLRARVTAVGFVAVMRAGVPRQTLWRTITPDADRPPSVDSVERVRAAIAKADPDGPAVPPPFVAVRGAAHAAWCDLGARLADTEPEALAGAVAAPAALRAAVIAIARSARTKRGVRSRRS